MKTELARAGDGRAVWVAGDHDTFKAHGDETGGAFSLVEAVVPPGGSTTPHRHGREDEAFYVLDGELEFHADGRSFTAGPGSWVTLAKGSLHRFRNAGAVPARMLILVSPAGPERFFLEIGTPGPIDAPLPFGPAEIGRMLEVAPRFGLEILTPDDAR